MSVFHSAQLPYFLKIRQTSNNPGYIKKIDLFRGSIFIQVDMVENNWNDLESFIFDWGERLQTRQLALQNA